MAVLEKIDSNVTGLRYAQETSIGVLPVTPDWYPLEPNEYDDFGGEYSLVARNPINASRQRKKGVIVDLDASGGFNMDLTQLSTQDLMQGFCFADFRRKGEEAVTAVDIDGGNPDEYEVASTTGFLVNSIIKGSGFTNAANNARNVVTAIVADTSVEVATGQLVAEAGAATKKITVVGYKGAAGTLDIVNAGAPALPRMTSTAGIDFTTLGLVPGEWIYIGGDAVGSMFATAANNGWARIYSISATELVFDKTDALMVTEASTTETIEIYFGRVIKNESDPTLIIRKTYQIERTLGAPETTQPTQIQSEYLIGSVPNECTFNFETADKATVDMSFMSTSHETRSGVTGVKSGNRPSIVPSDVYNTSNDFSRFRMAILDRTAGAAPTALFARLTEFSIAINNNVSANKSIGTLGAFDMTAGNFEVGGEATAYFSTVAAINAIRDNSDVTMDAIIVKDNTGIAFDIPLIALGDGRANVEQDEPILLDLEMPAAADEVFDHTFLVVFFDYLPDVAG